MVRTPVSFAPLTGQQWAQRISNETKGKASFQSLSRPAADGTLLNPFYTDRPADPLTLDISPGWRLIDDYADLTDLSRLDQLLATSTPGGADAVLLDGNQFRHLSLEQRSTLPTCVVRFVPHSLDFIPLATEPRVEWYVQAATPALYPWLLADHWPYRDYIGLHFDLSPLAEVGAGAALQLAVLKAFLHNAFLPMRPAKLWLSLGVGLSFAVELAKLRAARALVQQVLPSTALTLQVTTARWPLAGIEPHSNLIRTTVQALAGIAGGADALTIFPFDAVTGSADGPSDVGLRTARGISHLLRHESHLGYVADPAAGSYALEQITASLCADAEARAREALGRGGVTERGFHAWLEAAVRTEASARAEAVASGLRKLVGVNAFRQAPANPASPQDIYAEAAHPLWPWRLSAALE